MMVDTNAMVSAAEADQNGKVDDYAVVADEDVMAVSDRLLAQNKEAYEVLAK